jgi:hypothetical protein
MTTRSSSFGSFNYDAGADQARKDNVINETHLYFDSRQPTFKFNKVLGSGAAGVACCVLEWPTPHTGISEGGRGRGEPRRLVVKRAIGPEADRDLWDEVIAPKVSVAARACDSWSGMS